MIGVWHGQQPLAAHIKIQSSGAGAAEYNGRGPNGRRARAMCAEQSEGAIECLQPRAGQWIRSSADRIPQM